MCACLKRKWNEFHHVTKSCERNSEDNFKTFHALFVLSSFYLALNQWLIPIFLFLFSLLSTGSRILVTENQLGTRETLLKFILKMLILLPPICALTVWGHLQLNVNKKQANASCLESLTWQHRSIPFSKSSVFFFFGENDC